MIIDNYKVFIQLITGQVVFEPVQYVSTTSLEIKNTVSIVSFNTRQRESNNPTTTIDQDQATRRATSQCVKILVQDPRNGQVPSLQEGFLGRGIMIDTVKRDFVKREIGSGESTV